MKKFLMQFTLNGKRMEEVVQVRGSYHDAVRLLQTKYAGQKFQMGSYKEIK